MWHYEELLKIADRLDQEAKLGNTPAIYEPVHVISDAASKIGKASSGSWLGYHANVYYKDLKPPVPGDHFSQEWGLMDSYGNNTTGNWQEYSSTTL